MELEPEQYGYHNFTREGTGATEEPGDYRIISYPFDRYEIKVKVTPNNEFVGIVEVGINKDFLTQQKKISLQGFHDVEKFYIEH